MQVLVISVAGVQSSGKSTLLNTIFGINLETSVGCCTRGVNMALVPSQGEWQAKSDYILVIDTEGLCNPIFTDLASNLHGNLNFSIRSIFLFELG